MAEDIVGSKIPADAQKQIAPGKKIGNFGANQFGGASSDLPGQRTTSPLADDLKRASDDGQHALDRVIANGIRTDHEPLDKAQMRPISAEPYPTTFRSSGAVERRHGAERQRAAGEAVREASMLPSLFNKQGRSVPLDEAAEAALSATEHSLYVNARDAAQECERVEIELSAATDRLHHHVAELRAVETQLASQPKPSQRDLMEAVKRATRRG